MIPKEQKLDPKSWQTCLLFLVLFAAWCAKADSRADEQPFRASTSRVAPSLKLAGADRESELRYARLLIKAGLAQMAVESLRKIVTENPGTPAAQEAQQTLDSIAKTK
jgi:hypothetical protein